MLIKLGYAISEGGEVNVPLKHLAITGQTQESGKTTALEALITRSGMRAIAFVTKRGEKSFEDGRQIAPYFHDRADWEFVESILEATMKQRMKFERAWIVRACKGATTLADVQHNIVDLQFKAKGGMNQDMYMLLGEYLSRVVPTLRTLPKMDRVDLLPGVNVMNLLAYPEELQMLVIGSTLEWIHKHETDVVTVIPEAWKFVPQGRKTPVKLVVERLAREGAALKNYIWIDSQDMAGVEKMLLRACAVWVIGVQREINEVKRALDNIPAGVKRPKAEDVAKLGVGEFYACWGQHVIKTYVQPVWLPEDDARLVAIGALPPQDKANWVREETVDYKRLYEDQRETITGLKTTISLLETELAKLKQQNPPATPPSLASQVSPAGLNGHSPFDEAAFKQRLFQELEPERLYQSFKARLCKESPAILLALGKTVPEIEVKVVRETIKMDTSNAKGRIAFLIADGGLDSGLRQSEVLSALADRGMVTVQARASEALKELVSMGFLKPADGSGRYRPVEGMKVNIIEAQ